MGIHITREHFLLTGPPLPLSGQTTKKSFFAASLSFVGLDFDNSSLGNSHSPIEKLKKKLPS